ncbi:MULTISPECIES: FadR/GntR family transcriptional regulator [unclassified Aureimonas]|uniref:FadR/GntR family transcriptional regulator n=1 Tax=unclassified Aureimonas TaxID=2615206 RepID=UPI0009E821CA|nr:MULTISPECIES: FadR/GntR family transcriptional regulator [unclassified Aureimonas]
MEKLLVPLEDAVPSGHKFSPIGNVSRLQGERVHVHIAVEIGQRIVRGEYPPGSILPNEAKWAEIFKVSRSAVREAVKMLTAKSLLASRPKIGSRVEPRARWNLLDRDVLDWYSAVPDSARFLAQVQEFRHFVEPEAAALAATRRSEAQMADMSLACREMKAAPSRDIWMEADIRFHLAILAGSGNDLLLPLGVIVDSALRQLFLFLYPSDVDLGKVTALHASVERAIRLQRPDAARKAMRQLLDYTDAAIARKLRG